MVNATIATKAAASNAVQFDAGAIHTVLGVDFSGAALSGKTAWIAELIPTKPLSIGGGQPKFRLVSLQPIGRLAGGHDRETVNAYLVDRISVASQTFWACDFPFGLPIELPLGSWRDQLSHVRQFGGSAREFGLSLVRLTEQHNGTKHVRRATDREVQTPFDCYHYRIIYQTFHGMRDILAKIAAKRSVCVLPFQYRKACTRCEAAMMVEACPSSTLKRWGLPHQRYKQTGGRRPTELQRSNRRRILARLTESVDISAHRRRLIMNDPGGDALDAVLAGAGGWMGFAAADHQTIKRHSRYRHEGFVYC